MYTVSPLYDNMLQRRFREWEVSATVDGVLYGKNKIIDFSIENTLVSGSEFEIGTAIASKLIVRIRTHEEIPANARIVPYLALSLASISWNTADFAWDASDFPWDGNQTNPIPMGIFYVDGRERVGDIWTFVCYDALMWANVPYVSALTYPTTQLAVWDEICDRLGYTYDSSVVINPAYMIPVAPTGYGMRQVMAYIAGANASSVFVGKEGWIKFKRFVAAADPDFVLKTADYVRVKQTNPVKTYTRVVVIYEKDDGLYYEAGIGDDDHTLEMFNPLATQAMVNAMLSAINGLSYLPITMDPRSYPQMEPGDVIAFEQLKSLSWMNADLSWDAADIPWDGVYRYQTIALHVAYTFKGGLSMSLESPSKSEQQSEFKVDGTLTSAVNNLNKTAVKFGKPYFGVTNSREHGIQVGRSDGKSDLTLNSDEMDWRVDGQSQLHYDAIANRIKFSGTLEAADGIFSGDLQAAGGTFAGNLSAAGGTFRGALQAASGTFAGALQAATGSFSGTISASTIIGGQVYGTYIATSYGYPRCEVSSAGNLLGAYYDANNSITIESNRAGAPSMVFTQGGAIKGRLDMDSGMELAGIGGLTVGSYSGGNLDLIAPSTNFVTVPSWARFKENLHGRTLQQDLDLQMTYISSAMSAVASLDVRVRALE
ncbi:MAG: DUF3672 domain-containing protein [Gorillibacterium sp.]|nr:DUF3672 domain-containing protein [Gorillibacterium sp.]